MTLTVHATARRRAPPLARAALLCVCGGLAPALAGAIAGDLSAEQSRGRAIYLDGTGPSTPPITARIAGNPMAVPASLLPCASCHGEDGSGNAEGGVVPSDIGRDALTKPYRVTSASGRERPAYTDGTLLRAIAQGIDAGGNALDRAMPRYALSAADGEALRTVLRRHFEVLNASGGVFGRRLAFEFLVLPARADATGDALRRFLEETRPLALVAPYMAGREREVAAALEAAAVPSVGAITLAPPASSGGWSFYLLGGLHGESRALAAAMARQAGPPDGRAAIVHLDGEPWRGAAHAVLEQLDTLGQAEVPRIALAPGGGDLRPLARRLARAGTASVLLLAPGDPGRALMRAARALGWRPAVYAPAPVAASVLTGDLAGAAGSVHVAWSSVPADASPQALAALEALGGGGHRAHRREQATAVASAALLVEALRRSGHDVTRRKLVASLEGIYGFRTGLIPAVTFDRNRRVGVSGAHVARIDAASGAVVSRRWVALD